MSEPTVLTWTPEFEKMWRTRLEEMKNDKQPFREFITKIAELQWPEALELALSEIERLRNNK